MKGTYQLLVYADDINVSVERVRTVMGNAESLVVTNGELTCNIDYAI